MILVENPEVQDAFASLAKGFHWVPNRGLEFHAAPGDTPQVIAHWRRCEGNVPIGYIATHESSALAAIAHGADEAGVIPIDATALAAFVDRLELRANLRAESHRLHQSFAHAEKLAALGTLVAGVGHEINNPLSAMLLSIEAARRLVIPQLDAAWEIAQSLLRGAPVPQLALAHLQASQERGRDAARMFDDIGSAADAIASIVRDLRIFARTDLEEPSELVDVEELIDHAIRLVGREVFQHGLLERDFTPGVPKLVLPRNRVTQVIMNVLINAAHAIREVERPIHRVRVSTRADDEFLAVAISDTGPGIPVESLNRIFDPFFTTRRSELGTGLGLAISRSILRRIGGDLAVESVFGSGATFICFLPLPTRDMVREAWIRTAASPRRPKSSPKIASVLLVEDDERVLRSYVRLLHSDYRIVIAQDAADAIELLVSGANPDVVVMELDLPGSDGRTLLEWIRENRPALLDSVLLATAAAGESTFAEFLTNYEGRILHKPVRGNELAAAIDQLVATSTKSVFPPSG